jgi:hypothetical protein
LSTDGTEDVSGDGGLIGPKLPIKVVDINRIVPRPAKDE